MATAPQSRRLNLTRDQLAAFLTDQQQIRQFELLFSTVDQIQVIVGTDFEYQADTAAATANQALASLSALARDTAVTNAALEAKVQQALDAIPRLAQALELLALAPVRNNIELAHDVNGILPLANGGTGETTRQAAIDALAGAVTSGQYLRGNGTDVVMSAIQAADVPTLNQNTTGTAANVTGIVAIANGGTGSTTLAGASIVTFTGAETLTNKRINPRVSTAASTATLAPDISAFDQYNLTAQAAALAVSAPIGTPQDGNKLIFRILDNGTARAITWNATYTAIGVTLPTTTTAGKMLYVGCIYNDANTRWDVIALTTQT
jgi:hypothetical protein